MDSHLIHFSPEERPFFQQMENAVRRVSDRHIPYLTDFLDPRQLQLASQAAGRADDVTFFRFGGYEQAERNRAMFMQDYQSPDRSDWELSAIRITLLDAAHSLAHGDYLGALTGLGVKRSKYGDISVNDSYADLMIASEMLPFVLLNLTAVGRAKVRVEELALDMFTVPEVKVEERTFTVASPRLDAVLSDAMRISRAKILEPIRSGKVQVNFRPVEDPAHLLKTGDILSIRGYGRLRIMEMEGQSKKGRLFVTIGKYL